MTSKPAFTLRLSKELYEKLKILADKDERSLSLYTERICRNFVEEHERMHGEINPVNKTP